MCDMVISKIIIPGPHSQGGYSEFQVRREVQRNFFAFFGGGEGQIEDFGKLLQ